MTADPTDGRLVLIVGPTGVGKSEVAVGLAERWRGEIVSADSRALYRGMDIGTAKPTAVQRERVPHHLLDVADPRHPWTMAEYRTSALAAITSIHARGRLPFLVGGTGQYVTALLEGWEPPPRPSSDAGRRSLEALAEHEGPTALHRRLALIDPVSADRIDPRNVRRVIRLLEIAQAVGRPPSEVRRATPAPFRVLRIGLRLPRSDLYRRLDDRLEAMLKAGLVEEVRQLQQLGLTSDDPVLSAIGYRQIAEYLEDKTDFEQALRKIRRATRQLVRRQANWFRADDPRISWLDVTPDVQGLASQLIEDWLAGR